MGKRRRSLGLQRGPLIGGRVALYSLKGQLVAQKTRTPSGPPASPTTKAQNEFFAQATRAARIAPMEIIGPLSEAVAGTGYFLYDWLVSAVYGNAFWLTDDEGITYYPVSLAKQVSQNLDVLGQIPGDTLYRGEAIWQRLPAANAGQVLALQGSPPYPAWVQGQGPALILDTVASGGVIDVQGLDFASWRAVSAFLESVITSVDGALVYLQFYISGNLQALLYQWAVQENSTSGTNPTASSTSDTRIPIFGQIGNSTGEAAFAQILFQSPASATYKYVSWLGAYHYTTTATAKRSGVGMCAVTGPITGLRLTASSGTISSARLRIFGSPFPAL